MNEIFPGFIDGNGPVVPGPDQPSANVVQQQAGDSGGEHGGACSIHPSPSASAFSMQSNEHINRAIFSNPSNYNQNISSHITDLCQEQ